MQIPFLQIYLLLFPAGRCKTPFNLNRHLTPSLSLTPLNDRVGVRDLHLGWVATQRASTMKAFFTMSQMQIDGDKKSANPLTMFPQEVLFGWRPISHPSRFNVAYTTPEGGFDNLSTSLLQPLLFRRRKSHCIRISQPSSYAISRDLKCLWILTWTNGTYIDYI